MKIIISRKGFDTSNGVIPNPILPDNTLLSMPIPSDDLLSYCDLQYGDFTYSEILNQLAPKRSYDKCHLDPDIRENVRVNPVVGWQPAFGQVGAAQTYLKNRAVNTGDIFLFFGRFQQTVGDLGKGTLRFDKNSPILHIIYGYMEIRELITNEHLTDSSYHWHPHGYGERLKDITNMIYTATESLSFDKNRRGYGVFDYAKHRVLTLSDKTATWREIPCLMPNAVEKNVKNSTLDGGLYYKGIWQEMVLKESVLADVWLKEVFYGTKGVC
jgi:hypothetical protein